jgi:hypothetical protein
MGPYFLLMLMLMHLCNESSFLLMGDWMNVCQDLQKSY